MLKNKIYMLCSMVLHGKVKEKGKKMKKSIITAFVVGMAAIAQAASINWSVNTESWKMQDKTYAAQGTSMWLIDRANQADIVAALKNSAVINFTGDWESAISGLTGVYGTTVTTDDRGGVDPEVTITHAGLVEGEEVYYDLATLIIDNESDAKTVYYNISFGTEESYASTDPTAYDTANFTNDMFNDGTGWQVAQTESVPEPTSGLLMLIGMAGLALRRRHA